VKEIRRATRRQFSAENKIGIVLDGLRGGDSIAELCRRDRIVRSSAGSRIFLQSAPRSTETYVHNPAPGEHQFIIRWDKPIDSQEFKPQGTLASQNLSHENYHDDQLVEVGSDRTFGCTVGTVLMVIGAAKAFMAGMVTPIAFLIFALGVVLLSLGIVAPCCLSAFNRLWSKLGAAIAKVVNPIVLVLLFFLAVTPMALVMRIAGKRPLRLVPDRTAASYWIVREPPNGEASSMRRQF